MSAWTVPGYTESLELGSGASGRVVLAVHEQTGVPVAVKYLGESLRTRPDFVHGFRAEAELLGGLTSPYVAGFYEYVEADRGAAIVMELVDGVSLRMLLTGRGPLAPEAALTVLKGSLLGLADAHRVGVVHRDYKPENVLVTPEGLSKLVDFGIAVDAGISAGIAGTPAYMAPEQWTGAPASPAGDVYAATATFFECLTGHKPYPGGNLAELALQHLEQPVPVADLPEAVRPLVLRGMAKAADERPLDAAAFVADLEAVALARYGDDWEARGRRRLAALVALLLAPRPLGDGTPPRPPADRAHTVLGRGSGREGWRAWWPTGPGLAVSVVAVLLAILLAQGIGRGSAENTGEAAQAQALATTSAAPGSAAASPSANGATDPPSPTTTSGTPTAGPSTTQTATGTSTPTDAATSGPASVTATVTPTGNTGTTTPATPPTAPPSPSEDTSPPPTPPSVKDIAVSDFRQTGPDTATATITVITDGTGPVTLTVGWFSGNTAGRPGTADGAPVSYERSGADRYTITVEHSFRTLGCYWTVQATTSPASADGGASQQLLTRRCVLT
ncbi:serine/threonine-protein kinase [Streptomyces sp. NPDC018693]|uniref:serine/threonine-protein kinase n=1 Tax=unclassified Streptomyces TaxID=2593676 RepID=UPI0037A94EA2